MASNKNGKTVIRLGQSFTLGEVMHQCRMMEAIHGGATYAEIRKMAMDPLSLSVQKKYNHSRAVGRRRLVESDVKAINVQLEAAQ